MNQGKIRAFIAVTLPETIIEKIGLIQERLKKTKADIQWVKPGNIHLTLKFLGYINLDELAKLKGGLEKAAEKFSPFFVTVEEIGGFPSIDKPRVIWIGISQGGELLKVINRAIEDNLAESGFPRAERSFQPHLTLGRVRSAKHKETLIKEVTKERVSIGGVRVNKISIYKSVLTSQGPVYSLLADVALRGRQL